MGGSGGRGSRCRLRAVLTLGGITLAGLAACTTHAGQGEATRPLATVAPAVGTGAVPEDKDAGSSLVPPTDDDASARAALDAASTAVAAFARPDLTAPAWWGGLSPLLTPAAVVAYAGTDPAEVPAHRVTGSARAGTSRSPFLASVFVPTDAGDYAVLLVRTDAAAPWLAERFVLADAAASSAAPTTGTGP
jgi:hypothetical protein